MTETELKFTKDGSSGMLSLGCRVDQNVSYPEAGDLEGLSQLTVDFGNVELINSLGVRDFLNFLKQVRSIENFSIYFEKCAPLVVKQMSMLPEFVLGVKIKSVLGPYYCESCDLESVLPLDIDGKTYEEVDKLTEGPKCSECDGELEFDEPKKSFFFFLLD